MCSSFHYNCLIQNMVLYIIKIKKKNTHKHCNLLFISIHKHNDVIDVFKLIEVMCIA